MAITCQQHHTNALPCNECSEKRPKFKGIRMRKWGSWGSEIRMPKTRTKIWLGSYETAEQAARAYDAAVYCLRGPNAKFNFPASVPSIPSGFSLSRHQIQLAAARYARDELPSTLPSQHSNNINNAVNIASPSRSCRASETELWSNSEQIWEEQNFWASLLDSSECLNDQNFPSIDDTSTLDFIPTWQDEQDRCISLD